MVRVNLCERYEGIQVVQLRIFFKAITVEAFPFEFRQGLFQIDIRQNAIQAHAKSNRLIPFYFAH